MWPTYRRFFFFFQNGTHTALAPARSVACISHRFERAMRLRARPKNGRVRLRYVMCRASSSHGGNACSRMKQVRLRNEVKNKRNHLKFMFLCWTFNWLLLKQPSLGSCCPEKSTKEHLVLVVHEALVNRQKTRVFFYSHKTRMGAPKCKWRTAVLTSQGCWSRYWVIIQS